MSTIYNIIESIASNPSTLVKQAILESNKQNQILKKCFLYAENPRFNYYIKVEPFTEESPFDSDISEDTFVGLDRILNREVTGHDARRLVEVLLQPLSTEARIILTRIINRDLRCNLGTAICNKVWYNLIPEYPVMLASKFDEKAKKHLAKFENNAGFNCSLKYDGGRVNVKIGNEGSVSYHSRNGSTLNLFGIFDQYFTDHKNMVFDGELLVRTKDDVADRKTGNGFYTRAVRNTITKEQAEQFSIALWDVIPMSEFDKGLGSEGLDTRISNLNSMLGISPKIEIAESEHCDTLEECLLFYKKMRDKGEEGAIIKVANSVWEDKRSKNVVKLKAIETMDALVVGWEQGSGKYSEMMGNLICESSCGLLKFSVGSGFKDEDRMDGESYVGKIIEVEYNEVISSKNKETKSLFLPIFKQIRYDKSTANTLAELK